MRAAIELLRSVRNSVMATTFGVLSGCSTTPAELEAKSTPTVQAYAENYQEIYRRVSSTAKRCLATNVGPYASMAVDSELYSDLGYGEVAISFINAGVRNYYATARIEKSSNGSKMIIRSGNIQRAAERNTAVLLRWASEDQSCGGLFS